MFFEPRLACYWIGILANRLSKTPRLGEARFRIELDHDWASAPKLPAKPQLATAQSWLCPLRTFWRVIGRTRRFPCFDASYQEESEKEYPASAT